MNQQQNQKPIAAGKSSFNFIDPKKLFAALQLEEDATKIFERVRKMKSEVGAEGLKAFMWEVDDIT